MIQLVGKVLSKKEELSGTEAMNEKAAEEVFRFFHRGEEK